MIKNGFGRHFESQLPKMVSEDILNHNNPESDHNNYELE